MNKNKLPLTIAMIVVLVTLFVSLIPGIIDHGEKNRLSQQNIPKKEEIKEEVRMNVQLTMDENFTDEKYVQTVANLEDIKNASSEIFPFNFEVDRGFEWIKSEIEDYLVLKYQEPMISNEDVKGIQQILKDLNFYSGVIDGIYGPKTKAAVEKFQKENGLKPTGIFDLNDYHLLSEVYSRRVLPVAARVKPEGTVTLLIILDERTLYVLDDGKLFYKFPIAIGKRETPSPIGNWKIVSKDSWGGGFGSRWLGLNVPYGRYGIHGTNKPWSIGRAESHGCFRMYNKDVSLLSEWVTWGTRVYVTGGDFPYNLPWRVINDGDRGSDVWVLQNRLRELGYYNYRPDGVFGWGTKSAVMKFQKDHALKPDGEVSWSTLNKLGLYLFQ